MYSCTYVCTHGAACRASIFSAFRPHWQQVDADVAEHGLPGQLIIIGRRLVHLLLPWLLIDVSALPHTGSTFLIWFGPTPRLAVADPDLIREILLSRAEHFDRYESHPMVRQLEGEGLVSLRGEKWAHHRRVLAPTFHMDNLKVSHSLGPPAFTKIARHLLPPSASWRRLTCMPNTDAAAVHREDGRGHGGEVGRHGRPRVGRRRDRRVRVVPDRDGGRHHANGLRPELRGREGRVQAPDAAHDLRLRSIPQGLHPWIQVLN
jgi:hypothetical protein